MLRRSLARFLDWLFEPICGTCRQPVARCTCEPWWTDPL